MREKCLPRLNTMKIMQISCKDCEVCLTEKAENFLCFILCFSCPAVARVCAPAHQLQEPNLNLSEFLNNLWSWVFGKLLVADIVSGWPCLGTFIRAHPITTIPYFDTGILKTHFDFVNSGDRWVISNRDSSSLAFPARERIWEKPAGS